MIRKILENIGILPYIRENRLHRRIDKEREREEYLVLQHVSSDKLTPLTPDEKQSVNDEWGGVTKCMPTVGFREYEIFKHVYGFDARFLTHRNYLPVIARLLNDFKYTKIFDDKGLLGFLKTTCIRFPYCHVRRIVSDYYDNDMRQISFEQAIEACVEQDELFIKPSRETSGGNGAKLIALKDYPLQKRRQIVIDELTGRTKEYVVQECIHQHPIMAQFNPSSVNTFRITTLMLNGKFSVCSIILRCGKNGSSVDNWGAGGLLAHVDLDGKVNSVAYDIHLNEYSSNGDCVFAECEIPQIPEILKLIEKSHSEDFAICKFIGWDIAIDNNGNPVIIELNSSQPGVIGEQLVSGPIFGDRTQEVIDYCKSKEFTY